MKQALGWWFPDGETHLLDWMRAKNQKQDGRLQYQLDKRNKALSYVTNWRLALDLGSHVGLWTSGLAKRFQTVVAFEPIAAHRECFKRNVPDENVILFPVAVGEHADKVKMHTSPTSSGDSWVEPDQAGDVEMITLDDLEMLAGEQVDFMKLDLEGGEARALWGAEKLLHRCKPVVIVEQKPGRAEKYGLPHTGAVTYLQGLGYTLRESISGDYILTA